MALKNTTFTYSYLDLQGIWVTLISQNLLKSEVVTVDRNVKVIMAVSPGKVPASRYTAIEWNYVRITNVH